MEQGQQKRRLIDDSIAFIVGWSGDWGVEAAIVSERPIGGDSRLGEDNSLSGY